MQHLITFNHVDSSTPHLTVTTDTYNFVVSDQSGNFKKVPPSFFSKAFNPQLENDYSTEEEFEKFFLNLLNADPTVTVYLDTNAYQMMLGLISQS